MTWKVLLLIWSLVISVTASIANAKVVDIYKGYQAGMSREYLSEIHSLKDCSKNNNNKMLCMQNYKAFGQDTEIAFRFIDDRLVNVRLYIELDSVDTIKSIFHKLKDDFDLVLIENGEEKFDILEASANTFDKGEFTKNISNFESKAFQKYDIKYTFVSKDEFTSQSVKSHNFSDIFKGASIKMRTATYHISRKNGRVMGVIGFIAPGITIAYLDGQNPHDQSVDLNSPKFISKFAKGEIIFDCEVSCSFEYGNESSNLKFLYESKDWDNLVNKVIDIGLAEDEPYFYLGSAAEGLGYLNAAKSYYVKSIAATKADMSCGGWLDTCEGFEFPKDAQAALDRIVSNEQYVKQRQHKVKSNTVQIKSKIEANNLVAYKDDIPALLEEWPMVASDENKYLFAISINDYDEAPDVSFADRSGELFVKTMHRLGVPEENSIFLSGSKATGTRILSRLKRILNQITPKDTLYFYYAGHGLPSRVNDNIYILPVDGDMGSYEDSNMSIGNLYQAMLKSEAKHINVFIDACFSGRADQDTMVFKGVAGLLIKPRAKIDKSRMTVFTAGEGNQFANEYEEKGHRLFSYHLIKGLLEGKTNLRKLAAHVQKNVSKDSRKLGPTYTQEPVIYGSLNHEL